MSSDKPSLGSLFTGIGGFDLAFEREGFETLWQCEIDPHATRVLETHWPYDVLRMEDIRWVQGEMMDAVDVIVGGFPCTDISAAKDRWGAKGVEGEASGLWWEFARVVSENRPRWIVVENTGRLRNGRQGADLRAVVGQLARLGYLGLGGILDAAAFGLPARRPRVYIVARRAGDARSIPDWQGMADGWARHDPGCVVLEGAGQPLATDYGCARPGPRSYRKLSPLECERLQGFPDGWTAGQSDSHRYRQLGNAVAVPVAQWIARRMAALL